eukprot:CAMPEP_0180830262 /NCGR_PEP_ID=MMETSP1038_2-20121128/75704_1 /TAXON_ID=632150 /ORGANISM="Azadinium spinosum, Strain 3D9" /LENGTH=66 /DNA_ID=CAMNT_0022873367 /DNA_START=549 /DNA_END=749 /DNA_ORIENTATION=-
MSSSSRIQCWYCTGAATRALAPCFSASLMSGSPNADGRQRCAVPEGFDACASSLVSKRSAKKAMAQ